MTAQVLAQEHSQPQLIVLHLMGSHPQACDRTQGKYETFVQSKETSCYLYTMTQTDNLLRKLYDQLRNSGSSSRWFTFPTTVWPLKSAAKTCNTLLMMISISKIPVPFMVISSDDKAHRVIKARRSANDFLGFFSQWTGIKGRK